MNRSDDMISRRLALLGLLLLLAMPASAQDEDPSTQTETITKVATTSAQFLKLGYGARPIALGGSFVAQADDLSALYWNVAGLARMRGTAVQFSTTEYLVDVQYSTAAVGVSLGNAGTLDAQFNEASSTGSPSPKIQLVVINGTLDIASGTLNHAAAGTDMMIVSGGNVGGSMNDATNATTALTYRPLRAACAANSGGAPPRSTTVAASTVPVPGSRTSSYATSAWQSGQAPSGGNARAPQSGQRPPSSR